MGSPFATLYFLLCGGEKRSQKQDTARAKKMAKNLREKKPKAMRTRYAPFDVAEFLDNDEVVAEYLTAAMEDPNPDVFLAALGDVAKARGMAQIARESGLGRESLYKALSSGAHPRYETVKAVLATLGVRLAVVPADPRSERHPG